MTVMISASAATMNTAHAVIQRTNGTRWFLRVVIAESPPRADRRVIAQSHASHLPAALHQAIRLLDRIAPQVDRFAQPLDLGL
jgi:hypothetical protein